MRSILVLKVNQIETVGYKHQDERHKTFLSEYSSKGYDNRIEPRKSIFYRYKYLQ